MIKAAPLNDLTKKAFCDMFKAYYKELGCDDDAQHLIDEYILPDLLAGLLKTDVLYENDAPAGFVIYQKDDIDNDWNKKEGWGDIREIFIIPPLRRKGYGKFLLYTAEYRLKESGADKAYCLPEERSVPFFTACGYEKTDEYDGDLDAFVYAKTNLSNCKCK